MADIKWQNGTITSLATTALNSLANGSAALSDEYDNATNQYIYGLLELTVTWGTNPTAGNLVNFYLEVAPDGTNYSDDQSISSAYLGGVPVRAVTSLQRLPLGLGMSGPIFLPPTKFKVRVVNNSGQAFPASGSTLKIMPYRFQST